MCWHYESYLTPSRPLFLLFFTTHHLLSFLKTHRKLCMELKYPFIASRCPVFLRRNKIELAKSKSSPGNYWKESQCLSLCEYEMCSRPSAMAAMLVSIPASSLQKAGSAPLMSSAFARTMLSPENEAWKPSQVPNQIIINIDIRYPIAQSRQNSYSKPQYQDAQVPKNEHFSNRKRPHTPYLRP